MTYVERKPVYALLMMRLVDYSFIVRLVWVHVCAFIQKGWIEQNGPGLCESGAGEQYSSLRVVDLLLAMCLCACTEAKPWNWLQCHLNLVEYNGIDTKETICSAFSLCQNRKASPAHRYIARNRRDERVFVCDVYVLTLSISILQPLLFKNRRHLSLFIL